MLLIPGDFSRARSVWNLDTARTLALVRGHLRTRRTACGLSFTRYTLINTSLLTYMRKVATYDNMGCDLIILPLEMVLLTFLILLQCRNLILLL